jgi:predicted Zn-dependent peptidase
MEKLYYDRLEQTVYRDTLPNGLKLYVLPKPGFSKQYAFFATDYGSIDTKFTLDGQKMQSAEGVAHYLEHKMFDTKDGNALQKLSATGASPNAFTSYNITAYYFQSTDGFEENLKTLLSFVSEPYFTQESVDKEQGIIGQEIKMYEDNPGSRLCENLFAAMYQNHPLRKNIAGTVESIAEITPQMLYDCHRAFYDPSNMMLCVAADVDPERVKAIALEILPKEPGGVSDRDYGDPEPLRPAQNFISQSMEVSMPMFAIGFKCPELPKGPQRLQQELLGDLAAEILCGESSSLYQRLYEQGLIDSGFTVGYEMLKGMPNLSVSGDSDHPQQVLDAILAEADRIAREGVDEALFQRLKRSTIGRRIRGLDSFDGMCYRMAISCFDGADYFTFPAFYDQLTPEDVQKFIAERITKSQAVLSVIVPKDQEV